MNEEEKKTIEDMNRFANGIDMSCVTARQMQIILNLIEKLQKENEMLKRCHIQDNKNMDFVMANCILKEKVKDKIEALSKTKSDLATYIAVSERIRALQEILEESEDSKDGEG